MITSDQNTTCDLIMGFPLDLLIDLINCAASEITINKNSIDIISPSYKYAFQTYFQARDDKVIVHLPHSVKVVNDQMLETIAWGSASLQNSTKSYILKLAHHYFVRYLMPDSSNKKASIQLDYNGTEIYVIEGGKLDPIPTKMIRQSVQAIIKKAISPQILLEPPTIDIPFADTAVDLQHLTVNGSNKRSRKNQLYFETAIDDQKLILGRFETRGNASIDLNLTCLLRKEGNPLHISVKGINIAADDSSVNPLGNATITHNAFDNGPLSNSLIGKADETEWPLYQDLISANVKHAYNNVHALINPIMECFGAGLKTCEDVISAVSTKIHEPFLSLKPTYRLEYAIRHLDPIDISVNFLGLSLNPNTNSLCLRFNYIINGINENLSATAAAATAATGAASGFVYPYGLGMTINEGLLKKIFQAYWRCSYILPKIFCSDYNMLVPSKGITTSCYYSLNINAAELFIESARVQIALSAKAIGNNDKGIGILRRIHIDKSARHRIECISHGKLNKALTKTDINLSDNKLNITMGRTEFDINTDQLTEIKNLSDSLYNNLTDMFSGIKINLLNLPEDFGINNHSLKLSYNYTDVNPVAIIIGSKIEGLKRSAFLQKPDLSHSKKDIEAVSFAPKDKWGYEGGAKGHFNIPCGLAIRETEHGLCIYVVDRDNNRIQMFDSNGRFILQWGAKGSDDGQLDYPNDLSVDKNGYVYVVDAGNNRVQKFAPDGSFIKRFGGKGKGSGHFFFPQGITVDDAGCIYVTDANHLVQKFDSNCKFLKQWGGKGDKNGRFHSPRGIAFDKKAFLYVADAGNHRIQKFDLHGKFILKWGSKGSGDGQFSFPQGLAIDSNENVYVTDTGNNRVQKFYSRGKYITKIAGEGTLVGQFLAPFGIATDKNCDIYVTDSFNNRVQKFGC